MHFKKQPEINNRQIGEKSFNLDTMSRGSNLAPRGEVKNCPQSHHGGEFGAVPVFTLGDQGVDDMVEFAAVHGAQQTWNGLTDFNLRELKYFRMILEVFSPKK
jgi:hypothetical protein